jgi:SAM-dependent methyltransferase
MSSTDAQAVRDTLQPGDLHDQWADVFHDPAIARFYDRQFDRLAPQLAGPVLDAGCGLGHHTLRLAERGLTVMAVDFSPAAVRATAERTAGHPVTVQEADLTSLPFDTGRFPSVVCYGVLMHIPDVRAAIAELARVVAAGGTLAVSEGNMRSMDDAAVAVLRRLRGRPRAYRRTPAGLETIRTTDTGPLLIRHANIPWLIEEFARHGLTLVSREPGMLTENYARAPTPRLVHAVNRAWARYGWAGPAFGNLLIFRR